MKHVPYDLGFALATTGFILVAVSALCLPFASKVAGGTFLWTSVLGVILGLWGWSIVSAEPGT